MLASTRLQRDLHLTLKFALDLPIRKLDTPSANGQSDRSEAPDTMPTTSVYTDAQLIEFGRDFAAAHGGRLRQVDWSTEMTIASRSTICLRFGSWAAFCAHVGAYPAPTEQELLRAGRAFAFAGGGRMCAARWDAERPVGVGRGYVIARFGSWVAFCAACGAASGKSELTDSDIVSFGVDLTLSLGRQIMIGDWNASGGRPCTSTTIFNRFDSWSAFVAQVNASDQIEWDDEVEQLAA